MVPFNNSIGLTVLGLKNALGLKNSYSTDEEQL